MVLLTSAPCSGKENSVFSACSGHIINTTDFQVQVLGLSVNWKQSLLRNLEAFHFTCCVEHNKNIAILRGKKTKFEREVSS
jgi:hypothetical protein